MMNEKKTKNSNLVIVIVLSILLFVSVALIGVLAFGNKFNLLNNKNSGEKVNLKYTETNTKIKEGIYITDVSEVVENAMPSIVAITSKTLVTSGIFNPNYFNQQQYMEGAGSGIIIAQTDNDLMILTNNHVVEGAEELLVRFVNEKSYDAKIVGTSSRKDIAIISVPLNKIDQETLDQIKIATMGNSDELKVGNGIIAIGNALGYGQSVTTGVVSAINREITIENNTYKMIQIDAAINGGNSGGALLNNKGEVVGINSAKYSSNNDLTSASVEGMGFAIPISDVSNLITSIMNGEEIGGATIGIYGNIISEEYSQSYNIPTGFYVSKIVPGSGADKSDLEIGNIIIAVDDTKIKTMNDLEDFLSNKKKGDKITLTVKYISGREYKEKKISVTLS